MLATHVFFLWSVRSRISRGDPDFTVFYTAGRILRQGLSAQLYDGPTQQAVQHEFATNADIRRGPLPYIHPPFEALLFLPMTFLPYRDAFLLWSALNVGILFLVAAILRKTLRSLRQVPLWQCVLISLAFFPVFANFHQGQDAILLLLLVTLGFHSLDREADFTAGCWLGLGVFKYHLILPLVVILLIWRGRRLAFGFAAVASTAMLLSVGLVGWTGAMQYPAYAWHVVSTPGLGGIPLRQLPNLLGLFAGWGIFENIRGPVQIVVLVTTVALLASVAGMRDRATARRCFRLSFACAVIAAVLSGFSTNTYDLALLVLPLVLVADHLRQEPSTTSRAAMRLIVPAIPLLISPVWFFLWMRWEHINLMAALLLWWTYAIRNEIVRLKVSTEGALRI